MKNLSNVGFVVLLLFVLGCNCQSKLQELADQGKTSPSPSPTVANTLTTPNDSPSPTTSTPRSSSSSDGLTMAKYDQIKDGMSYREVADILGTEGEEQSSSRVGSTTIKTYQFKGKGYEYIFCNFTNDKLSFKSQANLK